MKRKSIKRQGITYLFVWAFAFVLFLGVYAYMTWPEEVLMESMMIQEDQAQVFAPALKSTQEPSILTIELNPTTKFLGYASFLTLSLMALLVYGYKRIIEPVYQLGRSIRTYSNNRIENKYDFEELEDIRSSFNSVTTKLNSALSYQKRFNASMAHELKTPLSIIKTHIDVLNEQKDKSLDDYQNTLEIIQKTVRKMNALVETLLDSSQEGSDTLNDVINVEELVMDVVDDLSVLAQDKQVELSYKITNIPKSYGNQVLMYRALYNLIENAIKYNKPQGKVHVSSDFDEKSYIIRVTDDGIGIPQKDLERIFEPFYRSQKQNQEGLGLGLALVQTVVHMHSGQIIVMSKENEGSVFELHLPYLSKGESN
jgi:signal transduction histidine kinase